MVDTPTSGYGLRTQELGSNIATWGDPNLNEVENCLDQILGKIKNIAITGDYTPTTTNYVTTADNKNAGWRFTGTLTANATITVAATHTRFTVINDTTGGFSLVVKTSAGTGITIPNGRIGYLRCDATNVENIFPTHMGTSFTPSLVGDVTNVNYVTNAIAAAIAAAAGTVNGAFRSVYVYTLAAGTTTITGADDNGNTLAYTAGMSLRNLSVTFNGSLQTPNVDYTAATGTSITIVPTLTKAVTAVVLSLEPFTVANTYTQAQVDAAIAAAVAALKAGANTWTAAQAFNSGLTASTAAFSTPLPVSSGGTGGATQAAGRTGLGLGTAAVQNTGTSGANVPLMNGANTWSDTQSITKTSAGATAIALALKNASGTASTATSIDFDPTNNGPGVRSASISASTNGANAVSLNFYTSNGGANTLGLTISPNQVATLSSSVVAGSAAVTIADTVGLLGLKSYTVATLPTASPASRMIYVSDGTSNKRMAVSDNTNWRFPDGAIVS